MDKEQISKDSRDKWEEIEFDNYRQRIELSSELLEANRVCANLSERLEIAENFIRKITTDCECDPNHASAIMDEKAGSFMGNFQLYITLNYESPNLNDFCQVRSELNSLGMEHIKIGVILYGDQWLNMQRDLPLEEVNQIALTRCYIGFPIIVANFRSLES